MQPGQPRQRLFSRKRHPNIERIEKLASLHASGAISDNDFQRMKSEILAGSDR
ncbi:SHOCT domain-containing protein [Sinorhizobium meliloti]|uniref:SHOCT domain-containing protein n=1 Tax=Rhizobium meliloti TaxID=382 RepID=UPI003D65DB41